jgi:hypothetical protein
MKKVKLTEKQKADLQKLRDEISEYAHQEAWRRSIFAKIKMIELQLKYDWRSDLRREMYLDKFLVTFDLMQTDGSIRRTAVKVGRTIANGRSNYT